MHRDKKQEEKWSLTEFQNDSDRRQNRRQNIGIYIPPSDDSTTDLPADIQCQCSVNTANTSCPSTTCSVQQQAVLTQHTEDLLSKLGKIQSDIEFKSSTHACSHEDSDMISDELSFQEHQDYENFPKQEACYSSQLPTTLSQSKLCTQEGITIPRTVFYGVDISAKIRRSSLPAGQEGGQTERRGSWKTGRPLTRVESLKEKIRQQEKETQRSRHDETEATTSKQEETTVQTLTPLDVTQEVSMAKSSPQLPVPDSLSLLQSSEREVVEITSKSDICGTKKRACNAPRTQDFDGEDDRIEREEELLEEEYFPPSLSPSPTLLESLDAMSRIYNLKTVGSRTTVCIGERSADVSPHSGLQGKYNPIRQAPSPDVLPEKAKVWNHGKSETVESTGVQTVQCQVERLQLQREPEEGCGFPKDKKSSRTIVEPEVRIAEGQKRPDILRETQISTPRFQPQQKVRSFTINAQNSAKPPEQISPSSSAGSPSSSTPSPPLFSIRSASGGPSKRGTTITITPRRSAGSSSPGSTPTATSPTAPKAAPQTQTPTPAPISTRETGKKRYPTAEEIQVIGGYQNLERSCLVKSRGTPKSVKVCFDEVELERVCEYPSEECVLASLPCFPQSGLEDGNRDEQEEDDEDEESSSALTNPSDISVCAGRTRFLKVDESCRRLSK